MWGIGVVDGNLVGEVHFFEISFGKYNALCNGIIYDTIHVGGQGYCHDCMIILTNRVKHKLDTATPCK